jgi:hypothetical protein
MNVTTILQWIIIILSVTLFATHAHTRASLGVEYANMWHSLNSSIELQTAQVELLLYGQVDKVGALLWNSTAQRDTAH